MYFHAYLTQSGKKSSTKKSTHEKRHAILCSLHWRPLRGLLEILPVLLPEQLRVRVCGGLRCRPGGPWHHGAGGGVPPAARVVSRHALRDGLLRTLQAESSHPLPRGGGSAPRLETRLPGLLPLPPPSSSGAVQIRPSPSGGGETQECSSQGESREVGAELGADLGLGWVWGLAFH
jgi:hypothetical protein